MDEAMTAFQLARRLGISPASVRLYARSGILPPPRTLADGRRGYDEDDAAFLSAIVGLRRLGVAASLVPAAGAASRLSRDERIRRIHDVVERERRSIARQRGRLDELEACLAGVARLFSEPTDRRDDASATEKAGTR